MPFSIICFLVLGHLLLLSFADSSKGYGDRQRGSPAKRWEDHSAEGSESKNKSAEGTHDKGSQDHNSDDHLTEGGADNSTRDDVNQGRKSEDQLANGTADNLDGHYRDRSIDGNDGRHHPTDDKEDRSANGSNHDEHSANDTYNNDDRNGEQTKDRRGDDSTTHHIDDNSHESELPYDNFTHDSNRDGAQAETNHARGVAFTLQLNNIQYSLLAAEPSVLSDFKSEVKRIIANNAGEGILPDHITLDLKPGSVIVDALLAPPSGASADMVQRTLRDSPRLLPDMAAGVGAVAGIEAVTTGAVTVTIISDPVVQSDAAGEPAVPSSQKSKLPFIIGSLVGGVAMLSCISLSCLLYRRCGHIDKKDAKTPCDNKDIHMEV